MSLFVNKSVFFTKLIMSKLSPSLNLVIPSGNKKICIASLGFLNFWVEIKHLHHLGILLKLIRKEYDVHYINRFKKFHHNRHNISLIQRLKFYYQILSGLQRVTYNTKYSYYIDIEDTVISPFEF